MEIFRIVFLFIKHKKENSLMVIFVIPRKIDVLHLTWNFKQFIFGTLPYWCACRSFFSNVFFLSLHFSFILYEHLLLGKIVGWLQKCDSFVVFRKISECFALNLTECECISVKNVCYSNLIGYFRECVFSSLGQLIIKMYRLFYFFQLFFFLKYRELRTNARNI